MDFIIVKNDGQKIIETNYWESEYAKNGYCYMSVNAGCYRLLIPKNRKDWLKDMEAAKEVVISRGPNETVRPPKSDAFEIMFEDNTESPFVIQTGPEQWERAPSDDDQGWKGCMRVYYGSTEKPVLEFLRVFYRRVEKLPCMKPAGE